MYLNPTPEYKHISDWIVTLIGKKITPRSLANRLSKHLTQRHQVRVKLYFDKSILDLGDFTIGAEYDSELDCQGKKQFIINLIINHPKHMPIDITGEFADTFTLELVEALVHEYQHQYQYRSRGHIPSRGYTSQHKDNNIKEDQEYLGQTDEIDAYAANIAARFYIIKKLNNNDEVKSLDLLKYYRTFGPAHPVVKRLLKKITTNTYILQENERVKKYRKYLKRSR